MVRIFRLAELIEEYGTQVQKQLFEKNGNLNRSPMQSKGEVRSVLLYAVVNALRRLRELISVLTKGKDN